MKPTSQLTPEERELRDHHEAIVTDGIHTFVDVGNALLEIAEKRLYRETHGSFEPYCREKWDMSARRAYQLCEAAKVVSALPDECEPLVRTERAVRELAKVPEEKRAEVILEAKKRGKVTAKSITDIAAETQPADDDPPRIKTYDQELVDAVGIKHVQTALEQEVIEALECGIANFRLLIDDIKTGAVDCAELGDVKLHSMVISKQLNKLQQELKCK